MSLLPSLSRSSTTLTSTIPVASPVQRDPGMPGGLGDRLSPKAETPLFEKPLEGPVYLMTGFGHPLPMWPRTSMASCSRSCTPKSTPDRTAASAIPSKSYPMRRSPGSCSTSMVATRACFRTQKQSAPNPTALSHSSKRKMKRRLSFTPCFSSPAARQSQSGLDDISGRHERCAKR